MRVLAKDESKGDFDLNKVLLDGHGYAIDRAVPWLLEPADVSLGDAMLAGDFEVLLIKIQNRLSLASSGK